MGWSKMKNFKLALFLYALLISFASCGNSGEDNYTRTYTEYEAEYHYAIIDESNKSEVVEVVELEVPEPKILEEVLESENAIRTKNTITAYIDGNPVEIGTQDRNRFFSVDDLSRKLKAVGISFDYNEFADRFKVTYFDGRAYGWAAWFAGFLNLDIRVMGDFLTVNTLEPFPRHHEIPLIIDGHRTTISSYEMNERIGERSVISLVDLSRELEAAQIPFYLPHLQDVSYVHIWDIAPYVDFEIRRVSGINPSRDIIVVYTQEPLLQEKDLQSVVDFIIERYPQLFTREVIFEFFGYGIGSWFVGDFSLFDLGGGVPGFTGRLMDAGSTSTVTYLYVDGQFQRVGVISPDLLFIDDERRYVSLGCLTGLFCDCSWGQYYFIEFINGEWQSTLAPDDIELTPAHFLWDAHSEVTSALEQQIWHTAIHPTGIIVDTQVTDDIVDLVLDFFQHGVSEWRSLRDYNVYEIKWSLINDNLLRVRAPHIDDDLGSRSLNSWHWLELNDDRDGIETHFPGPLW